ncbi:hypothetical protein ACOSP7_028104 [Xanthoceras sorbifolium]
MASNPVLHARTKHIELDLYFVRDKVVQEDIQVNHVPTIDQLADIFTKALPTPRFQYLTRKLTVVSSPVRLRGDVNNKAISTDQATNKINKATGSTDQVLADQASPKATTRVIKADEDHDHQYEDHG